jgi:tetratricopeptide (TPR) repeat protein
MFRNAPLMTWGLVLAASLPAFGQSDALNELYGSGVHAYNGGNYVEAYNELTRAIENGSEDPRAYYFRGLSYLRLGRPQEARGDFAQGAKLEMADSDRFYNVSKALERVQGRPRQSLERFRAEARLEAFHDREQARYQRYERIRQNEPNVLLKTPAEEQDGPAPGDEPAEEKPVGEKPPGEEPAEMTDDTPPPPPAEADPFGEKPAAEAPANAAPADGAAAEDGAAAVPAKKAPAGKLAKGLFGSLTRGAMKTAAGAKDQPADAKAPEGAPAPAPAAKPADADPFAN